MTRAELRRVTENLLMAVAFALLLLPGATVNGIAFDFWPPGGIAIAFFTVNRVMTWLRGGENVAATIFQAVAFAAFAVAMSNRASLFG